MEQRSPFPGSLAWSWGEDDRGFYLAVTDEGGGIVSAWEEDDFPVDVDDCDNLRLTTDYGIGYITR